jgi:hypothetical protein
MFPKGEMPDSADQMSFVLITCEGALSLKFKVVISGHALHSMSCPPELPRGIDNWTIP